MKKAKIVKVSYGNSTYYQIKQRHFIFFWWWVPAWINSSLGASAPPDTYKTLEEAQKNMYLYDGTKAIETEC